MNRTDPDRVPPVGQPRADDGPGISSERNTGVTPDAYPAPDSGGARMPRSAKTGTDWSDVYRALREDIDLGRRSPGSDLPTIASLAKASGLTAYGARRVLERLSKDGRAQSWQGKGYRVAMPVIRFRVAEKKPVFGEHIRALGFSTSSEMTSSTTMRPPEDVARLMCSRARTRVLRTETLRGVNGQPVALSLDYFPRERLDGITETLAKTGSVSASLAKHGFPSYKRNHTLLTCRLPTAHEALLLGIPRSQAVYATLGANLDPDGAVLQVSKGIWRADCVAYEF